MDKETGPYYFDVIVTESSGNLTFIISATDDLGLTTETEPNTVEFVNAGTTPGLPTELIIIGAILAVGGAGAAGGAYLYKTGRLKLPSRFSR